MRNGQRWIVMNGRAQRALVMLLSLAGCLFRPACIAWRSMMRQRRGRGC